MNEDYVLLFSGGKDSSAMLLIALEEKLPLTEVIYVDTTKEFPQTVENVNKLSKLLPPEVKFTKFTLPFDYYFSEHIIQQGVRKGVKGYGFATMRSRWCTRLKDRTVANYLKNKSGIIYVGYSYDELHRIPKFKEVTRTFKPQFPLIERKMTEKDALKYCYSKGVTFGGLYNYFNRVSCWCCPFKNMDELRKLFLYFPDLWNELKKLQLKSQRKFKVNKSVFDLEKQFIEELKQGKLKK